MAVHTHDVFAPAGGWLMGEEADARAARCLNGSWAFQPVAVPGDYVRGRGEPPALPPPAADGWEAAPLRVPSPWNGNRWGGGRPDRDSGDAFERYRPDSVYYPSYPAAWEHVEMGWLRRRFTLDAVEAGRYLLHFEAVMGLAQVYVNGARVGAHEDGYLPFEMDVTDALRPGENEVLVGIQGLWLMDKQSAVYKKMRCPYPHGSNTMGLVGIWQDVWLLRVPAVRVAEVYIKPLVDAGVLEADVTVANDTGGAASLTLCGYVRAWEGAPGGAAALTLPETAVSVPADGRSTVTVRVPVAGELALWSPDTPRLYALVLRGGGDVKVTRFGWRQFTLEGAEHRLNGAPLHMVGDICHPFGPYMFSRRWVESWYRLIKDVGGNAVRLHAQIFPRVFLDAADEMGLLVLDETAIFGSALALNFEEDAAWERYAAHYDGLILRDRNRPSVFGWSFGNELFAIFLYDDAAKRDEDGFYAKLAALGARTALHDTTRPFVTCDGDEDLRGTQPVWSKHYGHGVPPFPQGLTKPAVVGENGGSYYARPEQLAVFNGDEAFESYAGRAQALGIDLYANIRFFGDRLAYFSPSELVWFGLESLPYGLDDFARLPTPADGVFFDNFEEGRPGMYLERLPPYTGTLNPGWDPALPERRELGMAHAMRDALTFDAAYDVKWAARREGRATAAARLPAPEDITVFRVDSEADAAGVSQALGLRVELAAREASQLRRAEPHPWTDGLMAADLYAAEQADGVLTRFALAGDVVERGQVLLEAAGVDWRLFNGRPEHSKCGAVFMYEQHRHAARAAMVAVPYRGGVAVVTTVRETQQTLWYRLLTAMGLAADTPVTQAEEAARTHDLLLDGPPEEA